MVLATPGKPEVKSVLLLVNRPSGRGRTPEELNSLRSGFEQTFAFVAERVFELTEGHEQVVRSTQAFLASSPGPWLLISGGGGGTSRAMVQGLLEEVEEGAIRLNEVWFSSLRLGSGNLLPRYFGLSQDPLLAMQGIAGDLLAGRISSCCVYRCTCIPPEGQAWRAYGLTMAGLGQFARVPDDIKSWRERHPRLMRWILRGVSLENLNTGQYIGFSLIRALNCLLHPRRAEMVEIRHKDGREQFRLFSGMLINFDFPQLPFQSNCSVEEPRLVLGLIPQAGRRQTLATWGAWPKLDQHIRQYEVGPGRPVELFFPEQAQTTLALDEDTFEVPARIRFEVAALINFIPGVFSSEFTVYSQGVFGSGSELAIF